MPRLTETRAQRAPVPTDRKVTFLRCSELRGFCVRLTSGGSRTWCVEVTTNSHTRRISLGAVGVLPFEGPPETPGARDLAIAALNANRRGGDAAEAIGKKKRPGGCTLNDVWLEYERAGYPILRGTGRKTDRTIAADRGRWHKHVAKTLGVKPIAAIDDAAVNRWLDIIPSNGQRSHALTLVKSILRFAGSRGFATPHEIRAKPTKSREMQNFYSAVEIAALDLAAAALANEQKHRVLVFSAIRLLMATGARAGEIFAAEWHRVDFERRVLILDHDKTSENGHDIHLTDIAVDILVALPRINRWVFPSTSKLGHLTTVQKPWSEVCRRAGLPRYRPHDLRHSFASVAINAGVSLYVTGRLLGHRQATTTQRYAHLEVEAARTAIDKIAATVTPLASNR